MKYTILLLFFISSMGFAQSVFNNTLSLCGTPSAPSTEEHILYFDNLKKQSPQQYSLLTATPLHVFELGEEKNFNVRNLSDPNKLKYDRKLFVLKRENGLINIWVEKDELENNHVIESVLDSIYENLTSSTPDGSFDSNKGIFQIAVEIFGSPPDVDGNGKVDFLLTDIKDGWDGDNNTGFTGGFFNPPDQQNRSGSNNADILYIDTYPGIYVENGDDISYRTDGILATVSHELQHLIQYRYNQNSEEWINEGLSELTSFLCGYGLRSPGLYLNNSNLNITAWSDADADILLAHYSKVALWTFFLYEKYDFMK